MRDFVSYYQARSELYVHACNCLPQGQLSHSPLSEEASLCLAVAGVPVARAAGQRERDVLINFFGCIGEYSARADLPKVFKHWAKAGIAVHTYDAHGHGHSEPKAEEDRFLIWDFNHIVSPSFCYVNSTADLP